MKRYITGDFKPDIPIGNPTKILLNYQPDMLKKVGFVGEYHRILPLIEKEMNIFVLDFDIGKCARYHCDQHVVKMILESTQIVCTALNERGFATPYKSTHVKHPCVLWAGASYANLQWLKRLAKALNKEYQYRYRTFKSHSSIAVVERIEGMRFESTGLTDFPQAMPERYKVPGDPVKAYRNFYVGEKLRFARWTRRRKPSWIEATLHEQSVSCQR